MANRNHTYRPDETRNGIDKNILEDILASLGEQEAQEFLDMYKDIEELGGWQKVDKEKAWQNIQSKIKPARRMNILRYAAVVLLLIFSGIAIYLSMGKDRVYHSGATVQHIVLDDGSDVIMQPHTALTVEKGFAVKSRNVSLEGEAYFDVAKDKTKPFVIHTANAKIKVLGTKFYVRAAKDATGVDLYEGKVNVIGAKGKQAAIRPGQSAEVTDDGVKVSDRNAGKKAIAFGDMKLDNITLEEAIDRFNKLYGKKVIVLDNSASELQKQKIYMTVRNASVREFINGLELIFNISVTYSKGQYVISKS